MRVGDRVVVLTDLPPVLLGMTGTVVGTRHPFLGASHWVRVRLDGARLGTFEMDVEDLRLLPGDGSP